MKVKLNPYICQQFNKKHLFFEDGVIYYRDQKKMKELPNQKRNITKLTKALDNYSDESDDPLKEPEKLLLNQLLQTRRRAQRKQSKTAKWFRC